MLDTVNMLPSAQLDNLLESLLTSFLSGSSTSTDHPTVTWFGIKLSAFIWGYVRYFYIHGYIIKAVDYYVFQSDCYDSAWTLINGPLVNYKCWHSDINNTHKNNTSKYIK